ncbi:hypothetical protein LIER_03764 [Lithospermum erythrorhizon]|uniref:Uncharacterized protein n=1 Tax=Lithospermum erythrorhizon TaxID=34254 RepID=A0AAV3NZ03_LITER
MKLTFDQISGNSSPFVTAPSSPQNSTDPIFCHSAPTSPCIKNINTNVFYVDRFNNDPYSISLRIHPASENFDDFEFETSKMIFNNKEDGPTEYLKNYEETERHPQYERVSFSSWASVDDDHFHEDKSSPLKLPPRLQFPDSNIINHGSVNSTRTSTLRKPPTKPVEFDPFMVALQKVMEEERGRRSNARNYDGYQRRARSHSPTRCSVSETENNVHLNSLPEDPKGLKYARYVRTQTNKATSNEVVEEDNAKSSSSSTIITESKMRRIKGILSKYATFGRQSERKKGKSDKVKGKHRRMVLVKLKPVFCYAIQSPNKSLSNRKPPSSNVVSTYV